MEEMTKLEKAVYIVAIIGMVIITMCCVYACIKSHQSRYDVNGDGKVDMVDAALVERYYLGDR